MARGNFRGYLRGDVVWRKKYLYVLRPILAMRWIEQKRGPVPIEFGRLVDATLTDVDVRQAIDRLVRDKRAGQEMDYGPRDPVLSMFAESELARHEDVVHGRHSVAPRVEDMDAVFVDALAEIWGTRLTI
ncbi:MAG: nucleotidyltransferase domain-containing protein [Chloroflexota bacterium]